MNSKTLMGMALALVSVIACTKDPAPENYKREKKSTPGNWYAAHNPLNPYEYLAIGAYHNDCLEYFRMAYSNYQSEGQWIEGRHQTIIDYFCIGTDTTYCDSSIDVNDLKVVDSLSLSDSLFHLRIAVLPVAVVEQINKLLGFYDIHSMDQFQAFKQEIVLFESAVDTSSTITVNHKRLLLIAGQVARYSALYWRKQITQNFYGWNLPNYQEVEWAETSRGDVKGAIIGYLEGENDQRALAMSVKGGSLVSGTKATKSGRSHN